MTQKEMNSEGGAGLWDGEDIRDAEGCVLTVRCCSSGLVYSSYRSKGGRGDVGVTVMETKSAHTDNEIQRYFNSTACNEIRAQNHIMSNKK